MTELITLIGRDKYCALIGWDHGVATSALLYHKDTDQDNPSPSVCM